MTADYHLEVLSQRLQRPELDTLPSNERVQLLVKDINDVTRQVAPTSALALSQLGAGVEVEKEMEGWSYCSGLRADLRV